MPALENWNSPIPIQEVSDLMRLIVAYDEAVELGPLHYRDLELDKISGLKLICGNCDVHMQVSGGYGLDIELWLNDVDTATKSVWFPIHCFHKQCFEKR